MLYPTELPGQGMGGNQPISCAAKNSRNTHAAMMPSVKVSDATAAVATVAFTIHSVIVVMSSTHVMTRKMQVFVEQDVQGVSVDSVMTAVLRGQSTGLLRRAG